MRYHRRPCALEKCTAHIEACHSCATVFPESHGKSWNPSANSRQKVAYSRHFWKVTEKCGIFREEFVISRSSVRPGSLAPRKCPASRGVFAFSIKAATDQVGRSTVLSSYPTLNCGARASCPVLNLISFDTAQLWSPYPLTWPRSGQLLPCRSARLECPTEFHPLRSGVRTSLGVPERGRSAYLGSIDS